MLRLGKYTGKLYRDEEIENMQECGVCITEEQALDDAFIENHHSKDLLACINCLECPLASR